MPGWDNLHLHMQIIVDQKYAVITWLLPTLTIRHGKDESEDEGRKSAVYQLKNIFNK